MSLQQQKERRTVPAEAVELYTQYIHGEINRRSFLDGVKKFSVAGLSASTIAQALMPNYAMGQQISRDDERIRAEYVTVPSPTGMAISEVIWSGHSVRIAALIPRRHCRGS